jgi:hypothetical protein
VKKGHRAVKINKWRGKNIVFVGVGDLVSGPLDLAPEFTRPEPCYTDRAYDQMWLHM